MTDMPWWWSWFGPPSIHGPGRASLTKGSPPGIIARHPCHRLCEDPARGRGPAAGKRAGGLCTPFLSEQKSGRGPEDAAGGKTPLLLARASDRSPSRSQVGLGGLSGLPDPRALTEGP